MKTKRITIKVRVKVPKIIGTVESRELIEKLKTYAKELINGL